MVSRKDITRFDLDMDGSMEPAEHGRWVRHEDLVRAIAAERNKLAAWMIQFGFATGHGDTMEDLLAELDWQVKERVGAEREACAKLCEDMLTVESYERNIGLLGAAVAIRARSQS
jgi:hypothetical protein